MYDRIVIAVDGSEEANRAADRGLDLAEAFDAFVDVVYVVDERTLGLTRGNAEVERLRKRGAEVLESVAARATDRGLVTATELAEGIPAASIGEYATARGADLVVLGRQGMTGVRRRLLGGVTEQMLHRCTVPVYVVPAEEESTADETAVRRLLLPTDGSENADVATAHAAAIAGRYGAEVDVLNVVDLQAAGGLFDAGGMEAAFVERLDTRGQEAVERVVADLEAIDADLPVRAVVERSSSYGGVVEAIREYVVENDVDLVVMSSHGRSNLGRQVLGSVASSVLRTIDVPVLVVERQA
jgi:nucleotide-binding universal stress UspA family protein